jgi:DNA replication protein DnaC/transposase
LCLGSKRTERSWHKQRHTARRIWQRLVKEQGATVCESTVRHYVGRLKRELGHEKEQFLDLAWAPGEAQADFGEADFYVMGTKTRQHYFVLTFPFSNVGLSQVFPAENAECVCEALKNIFEYIGGVPVRIVFDNAAGVGRRRNGEEKATELFSAFAAHYGFAFSFCNPAQGHEKGSVENKVGYIRSNLFVPAPSFDSGKRFNRTLLDRCLALSNKPHWIKGERELSLFEQDKLALIGLPSHAFDAVRYERHKTDKLGRVRLESCHVYSTSPELALSEVICGLRARSVQIFDIDGTLVAEHPRAYGSAPTDTADPARQLALLARKPRAWKNSRAQRVSGQPQGLYGRAGGSGSGEGPPPPAKRIGEKRLRAHDQGFEQRIRGHRQDRRGHPRRGVDGPGVPPRRIRRARRPLRIRPCVRRGGVGAMATKSKEDLAALRARARSMYFSNESVDWFAEHATAGQLRAFCRLVDVEQGVRARRKRERLFRKAAFPKLKSFEGYDFSQVTFPEGYTADDLRSLEFIEHAQDFVFYGQTGRGKTHLALAVGQAAVNAGKTVRFFTTASLVLALLKAKGDSCLDRYLADLGKSDLVILDEFGYTPIDIEGSRLLFQVMSDCYEKRSLILTTNIEFSKWGTVLGDDKLAAASIDRIVHHGRLVEFGGESRRIDASLMLGRGKEE